ncbi:MAG: hypothetical protein ACK5QS_01885 [Pseudanabaenaceae cyanobacterium]|jgi:hypothetical protein
MTIDAAFSAASILTLLAKAQKLQDGASLQDADHLLERLTQLSIKVKNQS